MASSGRMQERFTLDVTRDPAEMRAAQGLRHRVFVEERGRRGSVLLECDPFDADSEHLVLRDRINPHAGVVATMRVARGGRYTAREFDIGRLERCGRPIAEAGRTCLHRDYRGGAAGLLLFQGMLAHLAARGTAYVVGTASFPGADPAPHMRALRRLRIEALAPEGLRPKAHGAEAVVVEGPEPRPAMRRVPPLIKSYLRAGAWIGDGAWVDRDFDTVDVCMVLDMARLRLPSPARVARLAAHV